MLDIFFNELPHFSMLVIEELWWLFFKIKVLNFNGFIRLSINVLLSSQFNEVKGINRIVYDITTKPPATIEFE